jgi:hypothetical protein
MAITDKEELFDVIAQRVKEVSLKTGLRTPQAFARWFAEMYYLQPQNLFASDGPHDGKVDLFFTTNDGKVVKHHIVNSKYTNSYNQLAQPGFYQEIAYFVQTFQNVNQREMFLQSVKVELRPWYRSLYERFDEGNAELIFITNCRRNDGYLAPLDELPVKIFHLEDMVQHLIDDLDATMPRTPDLVLHDIHTILSADQRDTSVPTSIVFARLLDFIEYMKHDPYDLLFARNVRVSFGLKKHSVNAEIRETFVTHPEEFVFSNNGITVLCEKHPHDPGSKTLTLINPRVVNGSQTLHSVRDVANPSSQARAMVRIIEIPPIKGDVLEEQIAKKRDILNKISVRSNRQNPIKKWDLVSNDDFQLEIYRFFRREGWFYERRIREWRQRSRELKSVGIKQGIDIKNLTQYIASYYWDKPKLGPASAKLSAGELFEGEAYEQIRKTPIDVVYQIFQVRDSIRDCLRELVRHKDIKSIRPHANLALFALLVQTFEEIGVNWGSPEFTQLLDNQFENWDKRYVAWRRMVKIALDHIIVQYKIAADQARTKGDDIPTYANYFKSPPPVMELLKAPIPTELKEAARKALKL